MTEPAPLVPPEVDLRDFAFMPLDVLRLRDSELAGAPDPEVFRCSVLSWCTAWHQVPAGSLPDDDVALARLLGFGRDLRGWTRVRKAGGLRGWIRCSDGRLYHPVVAEKAANSWTGKLMQRWRTECNRIKKHNQRHYPPESGLQPLPMPDFDQWRAAGCPQGQPLPVPEDKAKVSQGQAATVPREKHSKGEGEGQGQGQGDFKEETSSLSDAKPARATKKAPKGLTLSPELRTWAAERAPHVADVDGEFAAMCDHTFASARSDWDGTFRNWLRKAEKDAVERTGRVNGRSPAPAPEPAWRTAERERAAAFLGPYAKQQGQQRTIDMEADDAAPIGLG